ncbi:MAG TPA: arginine deiminase family protein [Methylomirabilota bacterium]|jgi:N-dimethylarginine dimethylaminohydrolase|nr:arginine deiminase family protein [Methylomirabilota bacterium]
MPIMLPGDYSYNRLMAAFPSLAEPPFEHPTMQEYVWGRRWGCTTDVGPLRAVLVHRPGPELNRVDPAKYLEDIGAWGDREEGWYWRGPEPPDLARMQAQHDAMVAALRQEGVEVVALDGVAPGRYKASSTRDAVIAVGGGAVVCRMGARVRRGEEAPVTRTLGKLGMPILRTIHGTGLLEGGSFAWLNERTAVVGLGTRANEEGARQLEEVLRPQGVELLRVQLPGYRQHLDGLLVMVDVDVALVNPTLVPYVLLEKLAASKIRTLDLHPDDHPFTINCLAVRPGRVLMSEASGHTLERLAKAGIEVVSLEFDAVYRGGGGIHCSTAPLIRDPV